MQRYLAILLFTASAASLAAQIAPPNPGFVRYDGLPIQGLYGLPGNFVPADAAWGEADTISFSDRFGFLVTKGVIKLVRIDGSVLGRYEYDGPAPILHVGSTPESAVAWLPGTHSLLHWTERGFSVTEEESIGSDAIVSALELSASDVARFLITHPDRSVSNVTLSLSTTSVISSDFLPGVSGPAFRFAGQLIWAGNHGLEIEDSDGRQHTLPSPAGLFTAEQMSSQWVHLFYPYDRTHWALHLSKTEPTLSRLPAPAIAKGLR